MIAHALHLNLFQQSVNGFSVTCAAIMCCVVGKAEAPLCERWASVIVRVFVPNS